MDEFEELYNRNVDMVYRICLLRLGSRYDAEDAVQNVFLRYLKKPPAFEDREREKAWFIVAARNRCKDELKCWVRSKRADGEKLPEQSVCPYEEDSGLLEVLMSLPAKYREVLYLYYYEEYSVKEIGSLLGRNESTVRTQLSEGRKRLREKLEPNERSNVYEREKNSGGV